RPAARRYIHAAHARLRIDQDISRARADDSAGRDVGIRLRQPRLAGAGLPAHGARTRCRALPAQAVYAGGTVDGRERMSCRGTVPFQRRRPIELTTGHSAVAWRSIVWRFDAQLSESSRDRSAMRGVLAATRRRACFRKTLFTIKDIRAVFLAFRICTDGRVNQ